MIKSLIALVILANTSPIEKEVEGFLHSLPSPAQDEAVALTKNAEHSSEHPKKCSFDTLPFQIASPSRNSANHKLFLFTSFSLPLESWKEHSSYLEKVGGRFVLQGLPGNSFKLFADKLVELRQAGVYADVSLDPPSFEKFEVALIPTLVLATENGYDKVSGNIRIRSALELFSDRGNTKISAQQLLKVMEKP